LKIKSKNAVKSAIKIKGKSARLPRAYSFLDNIFHRFCARSAIVYQKKQMLNFVYINKVYEIITFGLKYLRLTIILLERSWQLAWEGKLCRYTAIWLRKMAGIYRLYQLCISLKL